jgi:hypothetical protein
MNDLAEGALSRPAGFDDLEAVVVNAKTHATVTLPAAWVRDLLAYVRRVEASAS